MGALLPMGTAATAVAPDEKVFVMNSDNRNLLLAVALSMAVLFGWQILVVGPEMEKEAVQQTQVLSRMEKAKNKVTLSDEPKKGTKVKSRKTKYKTVKRKG